MRGCPCKPGKCNCKPKPGYPKKIDEAGNPAQQAAIAIAMKKAGKKPKSVVEGEQPGKSVTDAIQKVMPMAQEIWFHGSRATGSHRRNSDTDILVVVPDDLVGDQYLAVVRILQKLSAQFNNYDIQPTKSGTNIHRTAQEEGQLLWSNKQGVAEDREYIPSGKKRITWNGIDLVVSIDGATVDIRAMTGDSQMAYVVFDRDGDTLVADDLAVEEQYKGQGIAKIMYDYVKEFGFRVKRSSDQLVAGKKFWDKNKGAENNIWEQGVAEGENWSKHNNPRAGGMSQKSVKSYRRSHPGSKIQTAVTKKPSKLKKGSKDAKRRSSFCARMKGMKKHNTSAKTAHDPDSNINKSLRRWNCESVEQLNELVILAEQFIQQKRKAK